MLDTYDSDQQAAFLKRSQIIRTRPAIAHTTLHSSSASGAPYVGEVIALPFTNEGGAIDRVLVSVGELEGGPDMGVTRRTIGSDQLSDSQFYDLAD